MKQFVRTVRHAIFALCCFVAAGAAPALAEPGRPKLTPNDIRQLCDVVADQILSEKGLHLQSEGPPGTFVPAGQGNFEYEVLFYRLAGVAETDNEERAKAKLQEFWRDHRTQLSCSRLGMRQPGLNIAKLAVERNSRLFVDSIVRRWKLDLDFIDPGDGKTLLQFVEGELARTKGTNLEPVNIRYRDLIQRYLDANPRD